MGVETIKSSGGDYSTIAGWEAATDISLTEKMTGELYDDGGDWTERVTFAGATGQTASIYREIVAAASDRHTGTVGGGGVELNPGSNGHIFTISEDNFRIDGLIMGNCGGGSAECCRINNTGFRASHCIFYDQNTSQQDGLYCGADDLTLYTSNCIFYQINRVACHVQSQKRAVWYVHNCTAWNIDESDSNQYCAFGFDAGTRNNEDSIMYCTNCTGHCDIYDSFGGGGSSNVEGTVVCTNCAAADTSITEVGNFVTDNGGNTESVVQADQFVDLSTINLHLKSGSTVLEDGGTDLSGDSNLPVTDDIDYDARTGIYDIGAHEFEEPSGGGGRTLYTRPIMNVGI